MRCTYLLSEPLPALGDAVEGLFPVALGQVDQNFCPAATLEGLLEVRKIFRRAVEAVNCDAMPAVSCRVMHGRPGSGEENLGERMLETKERKCQGAIGITASPLEEEHY